MLEKGAQPCFVITRVGIRVCDCDCEVQVVRSVLKRPEGATSSIEQQSTHAKALVMLANVHKV